MASLIVGMGEVGRALHAVLKGTYEVATKDIEPGPVPANVDVLHVCMRYSDDFTRTVLEYMAASRPRIVDICTTVPPGTTRKLGRRAVHSTTRGLHPNLATSLKTFVKHIGGEQAAELSEYYNRAGITTMNHANPETTELAHILGNAQYGVNLMFADEMAKLCRTYGVDYHEAVTLYAHTHNDGYEELGHNSKLRMILYPPQGQIGGHCVTQGAQLIPDAQRGLLLNHLANYNGDQGLQDPYQNHHTKCAHEEGFCGGDGDGNYPYPEPGCGIRPSED